jgi:dolichol-phosphate mannosyltransferase
VELVMVDDGSSDGSAELLQRPPAGSPWRHVVARHERNLGLGAALTTGLRAAKGSVICTYDADCTYDPALIPALVNLLESSGADIACGSPYHPQGGVEGVPGWRLVLSRGASRLYGLLAKRHLFCYTSMFRVHRAPYARPDWISNSGFVGVTELLLRALEEGARVVELPVTLRTRALGQSKMRIAGTMAKHLALMGRYARRRMLPAPSRAETLGLNRAGQERQP